MPTSVHPHERDNHTDWKETVLAVIEKTQTVALIVDRAGFAKKSAIEVAMQAVAQNMSQDRSDTTVSYDFTLGDQKYRIERAPATPDDAVMIEP